MLDFYMTLHHQIAKRQCLAMQCLRKLSPETQTISPSAPMPAGEDSFFPKCQPQLKKKKNLYIIPKYHS